MMRNSATKSAPFSAKGRIRPKTKRLFARSKRELTAFHAEIANEIIAAQDEKVDVIGFEGHNICLDPKNHFSCQIGDGKRLAELTRTKVVNRFQNADLLAGGQGGPLVPVYYQSLCADMGKPLAVVNIGGCANITWIGSIGDMIAFDCGPGQCRHQRLGYETRRHAYGL